jgi:multiple sugar transport system permease protein
VFWKGGLMRIKMKKINSKRYETVSGILFVLPQMLGIIIFSLIPIVFSLYLSFTKWDFISGFDNIEWIGLKNYINIWKDVGFTDSMRNTIIFSLATVFAQLVLGLVIAVLINNYVFKSTFFKVAFFVPYISSLVAVSVVFKALLQPSNGPLNNFLASLGMTDLPGWFADQKWSLIAIILLTIWRELGYFVIVYIAAIKGISKELYESSNIDGAGGFKSFWYITKPMVAPTTFFLMVTGLIGSFKAFDQIAVTTQGGPGTSSSVLVYYIYNSAFNFYKMGYASSMAWVLFVLIFIVTMLQFNRQKSSIE